MKQLKPILLLLLTAALLLTIVLPAAAAEIGGDDVVPGQSDQGPEGEDGPVEPVPVNTSRFLIQDGMGYDLSTQEFFYPVGNSGTEVLANVADGMIVTTPVRIQGATLLIYKDGELWTGKPENITEPGEYVVMAQTGNQTPRLFTFTMVDKASSTIYAYSLPRGMYVITATRNGEDTDHDRSVIPMQEDGLYHVEYEFAAAEKIYTLEINVDRTPPEVKFSGDIDSNNRVHSSLLISGLQDGDVVRANLDGSDIDVNVNADGTCELKQSGVYIITVFDAAGNRSEYGYTIMLYLNSGGVAFFALLIVSIVALCVYILIKRRRLKIG